MTTVGIIKLKSIKAKLNLIFRPIEMKIMTYIDELHAARMERLIKPIINRLYLADIGLKVATEYFDCQFLLTQAIVQKIKFLDKNHNKLPIAKMINDDKV